MRACEGLDHPVRRSSGGADLQREEDGVAGGPVLRVAVDGTWPVRPSFDLVHQT